MTVLIHEECLGIDEMVDDFKKAYSESCIHRGVSEDDHAYFRQYTFMLIAMLIKFQRTSDETKRR